MDLAQFANPLISERRCKYMIDIITALGKLSVIGENNKTSIGVRATSEYGYISHLINNSLTEGYYLTLEDGVVVLKNLFSTNTVNVMEYLGSYGIEDVYHGKYFSSTYTDHQPSAFVLEDEMSFTMILSGDHKKLKDIRRNPSLDMSIIDTRTSEVYSIENDSIIAFNYETLKVRVIDSLPVYQILDDALYRYKVVAYKNDQDWKELNYHNLLVNGID